MVDKIVVIGIGNILMKDDGIGPKLVQRIRRAAYRIGVRCIETGTLDLAVVAEIANADGMVVIDAVDFGGTAGQAVLLDENDLLAVPGNNLWSAHQFGLVEALQIAKNQKRQTVVKIIGIQPAEIDWGLELSASLQEKMPILAGIVMSQVRLLKG
ncbi:MAG: hydrogenase maturation protease [Eubacteriales bacterium]